MPLIVVICATIIFLGLISLAFCVMLHAHYKPAADSKLEKFFFVFGNASLASIGIGFFIAILDVLWTIWHLTAPGRFL